MDNGYMQLAVQQALRGGPATYQNPQVGAVLVKDGRVISQGYHAHFGGDHAEVACLKGATPEQARGATLYVTLEPCSHYGKTPPCSHRVAEAGIKKVVIGQLDPHPVVAGRGRDYLRQHGVDVQVLEPSAAVLALNRHYNWFYQHERPWITLKMAQTLDGKLNAVTGERSRLTNAAANADSQRLRATFHAILVGERTLTTDDPQLTVRTQALAHPPVRLVVLNRSDVAVGHRLVTDGLAPTWLLCRQASPRDTQLEQSGSDVHVVIGDWTPQAISAFCHQHGWQSLLVEGGSQLHAQFVQAGLVEEWLSYVVPTVFGGQALPAARDTTYAATPMIFTAPQVTNLAGNLRIQAYRQGVV